MLIEIPIEIEDLEQAEIEEILGNEGCCICGSVKFCVPAENIIHIMEEYKEPDKCNMLISGHDSAVVVLMPYSKAVELWKGALCASSLPND